MSDWSHHPANSGARLSTKASAIAISCAGGAMYGMCSGIIGGVQQALVNIEFFPQHPIPEDQTQQTGTQATLSGVLVASLLLGAFVGCFIAVWLANKKGLRFALRIAALDCIIMSVLVAASPNYALMVTARTLLGMSIGFACAIVPWYVTDAIPEATRGSIGTIFQINICGFILVAEIINYLCHMSPDTHDISIPKLNYKLQLASSALPGLVLLVLSYIMHESPVYLASAAANNGRAIVGQYENGSMSPSTSGALPNDTSMNSLALDSAESGHIAAQKEEAAGWGELFSRPNLKYVAIGLILSSSQQLTGINAIIFYAPEIFKTAHMGNPLVLTFALVGTWNLLSVFISFALVDRLGRRALMLGALAVMAVGTGLMAVGYQFLPDHIGPLAIVAILLFVGAFECGPGPLFFLMAVESFPPHIRDVALSLTQSSCWIFSIIVTFGFPVIKHAVGNAATFLIFFVLCVAGLALIFFFVPETGKQKAVASSEKDKLAAHVQADGYGTGATAYQKL